MQKCLALKEELIGFTFYHHRTLQSSIMNILHLVVTMLQLCIDQFETSTYPPLPGNPRAFDSSFFPGVGNLTLGSAWGAGNLNHREGEGRAFKQTTKFEIASICFPVVNLSVFSL